MNDLQLNQDVPNAEAEENQLNEFDILKIFINIVPSLAYSVLIGLILIFPNIEQKEEDFSKTEHIIIYLKIILIIYSLYILKGVFYYFAILKNKINFNGKMITEIFNILLDISYFIFTIAGNNSYKKLGLDFIINNIYKCIFIYSLLFIGYTHIFLFFVNIIFLILYFIYNLMEFLNDEMNYYHAHPGTFEILNSELIEQKVKIADKNNEDTCSICLCDIVSGDKIITLNCSQRHFFHKDCIKKWLKFNLCCPLCKSHNII